jgi:hypothetical protein
MEQEGKEIKTGEKDEKGELCWRLLEQRENGMKGILGGGTCVIVK